MGKRAPSPPPAPDYAGAATAQGTANKDAARVASQLNNPAVIGPGGKQSWQTFDQTGYDKAKTDWQTAGSQGTAPDPNAFYTSEQPGDRPLLIQSLSPGQQSIYDTNQDTQLKLAQLGSQGAEAVGGTVGTTLDLSGMPAAPGPPGQIRDDVINAMMSRVNTDYGRAMEQKKADLTSGGIPVGSEAWKAEMDRMDRGLNDARQQAIIAGTGAASQDFSQTQVARKDAIAEALLKRQSPLNEISALMSGSQINNQFAMPGVAPAPAPAPAPIFAATNAAGQYGIDVYNAQAQQRANMQQGLFGLGSAGILAAGMRR